MNKKFFIIGVPSLFIGILGVVLLSIYGLSRMDGSVAEKAAFEAFGRAYTEFVESDMDFTKCLAFYGEEKQRYSGNVLFNDTDMLDFAYAGLLKGIPVEYSVVRSPGEQLTGVDIMLGGDGQMHVDGVVSQSEIILKVEEFYDGYFKVPNSNIKENYNASLWYSLFGNILAAFPDEFSIDLYPDIDLKEYIISEHLKRYDDDGVLAEIIHGVSVEKKESSKEFLVGDNYVSAGAYEVTVSKKSSEALLEMLSDYMEIKPEALWKPEKYKFIAYISSDKILRGLEFEASLPINGNNYEIDLFISLRGKNNIFEKVLTDVKAVSANKETYSFRLLIDNIIENETQRVMIIAAMNEPYISRLFETELKRNVLTNEFTADMAVNIQGLSVKGLCSGSIFKDEMAVPENALGIYELNLWQILNIYSAANWSFIK